MKDTRSRFAPGDIVRVLGVPPGVETMPAESRRLFGVIVGRTLRVDEITDWGDLVLNVRADGTQASNGDEHTLWLPQACAEVVTPKV